MEIARSGNYVDADREIGAIFAALADPTRRRLVELLRDGDQTVNELASHFAIGVPGISKHLTILENAKLLSRHREAQWRRCRLEADAFERLNAWTEHYTNLWNGSLDRLDGFLAVVQTPGEDER